MNESSPNTLASPAVAAVLARLLDESNLGMATLRAQIAGLDEAARAELFAGARRDYRDFYARARDLSLAVSEDTGKLLYLLARASRARAVVEFGTSFGVSTLYLAAALADNGGGRVISSEFEPGKVIKARENLAAAGLAHLVEIREGDAIETLARDLPAEIDLVLLDGAKVLYPKILALLEPRLRVGALVVADNADDSPEFLAHVRGGNGYLALPFGGDVELAIRLA